MRKSSKKNIPPSEEVARNQPSISTSIPIESSIQTCSSAPTYIHCDGCGTDLTASVYCGKCMEQLADSLSPVCSKCGDRINKQLCESCQSKILLLIHDEQLRAAQEESRWLRAKLSTFRGLR